MSDSIRRIALTIFANITKDEYMANIIELGCYEQTIRYCEDKNMISRWPTSSLINVYNTIVNKVCINLDPGSSINNGNSLLLSRIQEKKIDPYDLGRMSAEELNPHCNASYREIFEIRNNQKIEEKTSSFFTCPECKGKETTYRDVQLRSADEGSTLRIYCKICHHVWSQYG